MKRLLIVLSIVIVCVFLISRHESNLVNTQVQPVLQFWNRAINQAQEENTTTLQFLEQYTEFGQTTEDSEFGPMIIQDIQVNGPFCSVYRIEVLYRNAQDGSANLTMVSSRGIQGFCWL